MSSVEPIRFGDKYLLLDQIGAGGVAEVFRGKLTRDKGFEKLIVIKKLLAEYNSDREMVDIFIREARLAALLQHDNIAATYDFGEIDGEYFLAMEYLFGKNLHSVMVRAREHAELFGLSEALVIGSKICEGMEYAHNLDDLQHRPLNIVHRDLTPHNIFITYDGKVKILDFGVAQAELFDNKTREGVVKGKISYMSPERLSGEDVDSRSDIFSIGILLYEMIGRRRMYQGDTAELIRKCLTAEYENLKLILPELDPAVHNILDKALAVEVDRRYQSCAEMQSDIDELLFQMQLRGGYRLLKGAIRGLFAEEYDTEHRQVGEVLSIDGKGGAQRDKTNISIVREGEGPEDKTAMLLHRPPAQSIKLYWSRCRHWLDDKYLLIRDYGTQCGQWLKDKYLSIRDAPDRRRVAIPFVVAGAALMLLVVILIIRTSPDQQDEVTTPSVAQDTVRKPIQEEVRPEVETVERQEIVEEKVDSEALVGAAKGQEPESSVETVARQEIVEEKVDGEALVGAVKGQEPESAALKALESEPDEVVQTVPESFKPMAEEPPQAQNLVVKSNKVPVLKKQELKKKKILSETSQSM
ncbi:MAG: serine/threonine protein kinase, partial [Desulfocapsaceae bacterium]